MISPWGGGRVRRMQTKWMGGVLLLAVTACTGQPPIERSASTSTLAPAVQACAETGEASWYHGARRGRTAARDLTAAHKTLPFGTLVHVAAVETGQSVMVRINDRGPFGRGRVIDLSASAASELGILRDGVARVRLEVDGATAEDCPLQEVRFASD
jgi:rare lipoprotein A